jgi:hypothetical protein
MEVAVAVATPTSNRADELVPPPGPAGDLESKADEGIAGAP